MGEDGGARGGGLHFSKAISTIRVTHKTQAETEYDRLTDHEASKGGRDPRATLSETRTYRPCHEHGNLIRRWRPSPRINGALNP